jgi:acyl carrier protein
MTVGEARPDIVALVRATIAAHLDVNVESVTSSTTLGSDLAMDSLDVFAVIEGVAKQSGLRVTLNYNAPWVVDRIGQLDLLTVEDFAGCLLVT